MLFTLVILVQKLFIIVLGKNSAFRSPYFYRLYMLAKIISIFHVCMVWIEKSVTRVTDRHHEACRVMPNSDPE